MPRRHAVAFLITSVLVVPAARGGQEDISERVEAILNVPGFQNGHWGILVVDRSTGEVVHERNADQLFRPASVTKLYSTAAALAGLGADFRFQTPVKRTSEPNKNGVLDGDLILVGSGDFSLGGRTGAEGSLLYTDHDHSYAVGNFDATLTSEDPLAPLAGLDSLAREIAATGIRSVRDVLVDDRLFDAAESTGSGPSRVSPIVVNDNLVDVVVTPAAKPGEPADVRIVPTTSYVSCDMQVLTTPEGVAPILEIVPVGPRRFLVRGRLPVGHRPVVKVYEVNEPADFARALFIETLRRRGVTVIASPLARTRPTDSPPGPRSRPCRRSPNTRRLPWPST